MFRKPVDMGFVEHHHVWWQQVHRILVDHPVAVKAPGLDMKGEEEE
jgi:hypothetical protein